MDINFDYQLSRQAIVLDVGGYEGDFTEIIRRRYGCGVHVFEPVQSFFRGILQRFEHDPLVWPYSCALEDEDREGKMYIRSNSSSLHIGGAEHPQETIRVRDIMLFLNSFRLPHIDLLKLNCEGSEYPLLNQLMKNAWLPKVRHLVVQFHEVHGNARSVDFWEGALSQTHQLAFKNDHWQWHKLL